MGYSVQRFITSVDPNLICGICSSVLKDPVLTPCGHSFCQSCLSTWLSRPETDTCSECRSHVAKETAKPVLSLRNLINGFDVECDNNARGCKVIIKLERLKSHFETCGYCPLTCAGCDVVVNKFQLAIHQIRCEGIATSVRDKTNEFDGTSAQKRLSQARLSQTLTSIDVSELISKLATLEFKMKTLKRDLQIAESKNRVLEREFNKKKEELNNKQYELIDLNSDLDPDCEYGYIPQSIARLSILLARFLLKKPGYIDRDKIFVAVRRCYDKYARCGSEFEHDIHMLVATAFASNWFTDDCRTTLHFWLQSIARYRQLTTVSAKYLTSAR